MIKLSLAKVGKSYEILGFEKEGTLLRFFELGFVEGQRVKILASSPLNKVLLLEIAGYVLSVRRELLENVWVK